MADAAPPRQRDLASVGEAWGFGQFPAAVDRSKGGLLDASGDEEAPADENVRLRGALQQLQLALQHTQSALVDRYRGGSHKTVGGAQFRMGDMGSRGVKAPIPPRARAPSARRVKLVLKKTRTEKDAAPSRSASAVAAAARGRLEVRRVGVPRRARRRGRGHASPSAR